MSESVHVIILLLKLAVERAKIYRRDLTLYLISWAAFTTLLLVFWSSVLTNFAVIAFTQTEALGFIGIYYIAWGLASFFWGIRDLHIHIINGSIDVYLTKPINPLILIVLVRSHVGVVLEILTGLVLVSTASLGLSLYSSPVNILFSIFFLFGGVLLWALIYGALSLLSFFIGRMDRSLELMDYAYEYAYYPTSFMPTDMKNFLTWVLPLTFLVTLPTLGLLGKLTIDFEISWLVGESVLILIWVLIFVVLFRKGLKVYRSAGG